METDDQGKAEKILKDFGKRLDQFYGEVREATTRVESDLRMKYEELKVSAEKVKKEAQNKDRWKEIEISLKKAGEELEKALKTAFGKRNP